MTKIKISTVSYTNSLPFIYGIEKSSILNKIELSKDIPSVCSQKLLDNEVDIGLIPVVTIPKINYSEIISDFCISAAGPVRSVILGSFRPLDKIGPIKLDYQSKSSVVLIKILAKKYWNLDFQWIDTINGFENRISMNEGALIIGDKALQAEKNFPYVYDLAEEWIKFTGLPFVFACWVSNKKIDNTFKSEFSEALNIGVHSINNLIKSYDFSYLPKGIDPKEYFTKNIDFQMDAKKKEGLSLFLEYAGEYQ